MQFGKPQLGLSTLLLTTAFIAVWSGGMIAEWKLMVPAQQEYLAQTVIWLGPFWFPFVFVAYAIGRRALTLPCVLAFAFSEAAVFGAAIWLSNT